MREIGHFDFGENLRPINFDGWLDKQTPIDADSVSFWLEYWVASYSYLLTNNTENIQFLSYDGLCEEPERGLRKLVEVTESKYADELISTAGRIHNPRARNVDTVGVSQSLLREAERIHTLLRESALN